jgi:hypothetical protein
VSSFRFQSSFIDARSLIFQFLKKTYQPSNFRISKQTSGTLHLSSIFDRYVFTRYRHRS